MNNEYRDLLTDTQFKLLRESFFSFWTNPIGSDRQTISEIVAVTSVEDLQRLLEVIDIFVKSELPEEIKNRLIVSNVKI